MKASLSYRLKRPNSKGTTSVVLDVCLNNQRVRIYTGISVSAGNWDSRRQCLKAGDGLAEFVNRKLARISAEIARFESQALLDGEAVDIYRIQACAERVVAGSSVPSRQGEHPAAQVMQEWIDLHHNERSHQTILTWKGVRNHICGCDGSVSVSRMDKKWLEKFIRYLREERGLTDHSLWKVIRVWRTFSRWAEATGYKVDSTYRHVKSSRFKVRSSHATRLTREQLETLKALNLKEEPALENVRKLFLLQCCLGVRYSDLTRILSESGSWVRGDWIQLRTKKTDVLVKIPLLPMAKELLEPHFRPHPISNQRYNEYLKLVGEAAGFTDQVVKTVWRGSVMTEERIPLHDVISTHVAKRTFVTLMIAAGVQAEVIMRVTGNSRKTIDTYINLNDAEIESDLLSKGGQIFNM